MTWTTRCRHTLEVATAVACVAMPSLARAAGGGDAAVAGFDWSAWLFQLINFAIFAGIILYFGLPKARNFFRERREELVAELEEARRMREEAEARLEEYTAKLEALEGKREELLDEYHEQGQREKERLIEEAKREIEKMRADAETTIDQEVRKAVADLEQEAVEMAVEIARKAAREKLDASKQEALFDEYVTELSEQTKTRPAS